MGTEKANTVMYDSFSGRWFMLTKDKIDEANKLINDRFLKELEHRMVYTEEVAEAFYETLGINLRYPDNFGRMFDLSEIMEEVEEDILCEELEETFI